MTVMLACLQQSWRCTAEVLVLWSAMATKMTAETKVWSTDSAILWTSRSGWSCLRSCMSASSAIAGYLLRCCQEIFQSSSTRLLSSTNLCQLLDSRGRIQGYCISWASTWCDQSSAASAVQLIFVQIAPYSRRRGNRFDGIRMTWPSHRSCRCSNRCSAESILARWHSLYGFSCTTSGCLESFVGNGYDGLWAPWYAVDMEPNSRNHTK